MSDQEAINQQAFADKVVWITGASSGIGEGAVEAFARSGAKVVLSSRNTVELNRVRDNCIRLGASEEDLLVLPLDVVDHAAMPAAVAAVLERFSRIDVLINNAGLGQRSFCLDTQMHVYRTIFEVDVMGPIALTKQVLPVMVEQGSGQIAVTSSLAGKVGVPRGTGLSAAKHAVMGFFDALRTEVACLGIKVNTLVPGLVRTNTVANGLTGDGTPMGAEVGVMESGITIQQAADIIISQMALGTDEIVVGDGPETKMLDVKREDPTTLFRNLEKAAEKMYTS